MSVYASIPGIDADAPCGPPWIYLGSHVLPDDLNRRGGTVGLAHIPSHITRNGRDDQPADGTPWPWLRVSIDPSRASSGDPTVLLNPAQVQYLRDQLTNWLDSTGPEGKP